MVHALCSVEMLNGDRPSRDLFPNRLSVLFGFELLAEFVELSHEASLKFVVRLRCERRNCAMNMRVWIRGVSALVCAVCEEDA